MTLAAGCIGRPVSLSPEEALTRAATRIERILNEWEKEPSAGTIDLPLDPPKDPRKISFWYYTHPVIGPAFTARDRLRGFEEEHPDVALEPRFIGDWFHAVQKLTVSLAADDLPDVAMVKRGWVGPLIEAGRIFPIDMVLDKRLLDDLRPTVRAAFSAHGALFALPADGFCAVLLYNKDVVGDRAPRTWQELRETARRIAGDPSRPDFYPIGHIPYLESLWSAGGDVYKDGACGLTRPEAIEALRFLVSLRDEGWTHPRAFSDAAAGLELFASGYVGMTAASSEYLPQLGRASFPIGVAPIPGKTAPVSSVSDNAVVVFSRYAEAKRGALAALLDYLTGPNVQGAAAVEIGSAPVRISVAERAARDNGIEDAYACARGTPLIRPWSAIEDELQFLGWIARPPSPRISQTSD
mgnify:CR=1 FL=1